jgi:hypothetical protein
MSLTITTTPTHSQQLLEPGLHIARCVQILDLGTQLINDFVTGQKIAKHKVRISWELPEQIRENTDPTTGQIVAQPMIISKIYKATLHKKSTLYKDLAGWRGRDFTPEEIKSFCLTKLLDKPCTLTTTIKTRPDQRRAVEIVSISPLMKNMVCPPRVRDLVYLDLDDWNQEVFDSLPNFVQEMIKQSEEYQKIIKNSKRTVSDIQPPIPAEEVDLDAVEWE